MYDEKKEKINKAYVALYTCATSRMIHLDLVPSLTAKAFIRSQKRFMSRKGVPKMILSDNAKTFKSKLVKRFNAKRGIKWKFNLARAPWWGGLFERLVRSTKRCLRKAVGKHRLTFEELVTVLDEIEAVLNSRPITYVYENDIETPLTPSHLFCGRRLLDQNDNLEQASDEDVDVSQEQIVERAKGTDRIVAHFWNRWSKEYLLSLREAHKIRKGKKGAKVRVGEVVFVEEKGVKRAKWQMGRIEKVVVGRDGTPRGATIKTKNGTVSRPLQKIYPLEVMEEDAEEDSKNVSEVIESTVPKNPNVLDNLSLQTPPLTHSPLPTLGEEDDDNGSRDGDEEESSMGRSYSTPTTGRPRRQAGAAGERRRRGDRSSSRGKML